MPVDKTTITTLIEVHPGLFDDPAAFTRKHGLPIRTTKPTKGRSSCGPTSNLALDVLTYKGIKVKLSQITGDPLTVANIHFNPGVCLHGHNGRTLSLCEFLHALSLLVTHLKPLLKDPNDWVDLVPGLRSEGRAHWSYLEIPFQSRDPDGTLLSNFRNLRHPNLRTIRHWPTSIQVGGQTSKLQFCIYRKAIEMMAHGKLPQSELHTHEAILRLEARMKGQKLVDYIGNERNVEKIEGTKMLVRFYPQDLVQAHRKCFTELEGVYSSDQAPAETDLKTPLKALGKLLASAALAPCRTKTFSELMESLKFYTGDTALSSKTIARIRKAGLAELSHRSSMSSDSLFSDAAYRLAYGIASQQQEGEIRHDIEDTHADPLITAAYRPRDQRFLPLTAFPHYWGL